MNHQAVTYSANKAILHSDIAVKAINVVKSYNQFKALQDVSFDVLKGEVIALIGHNGAGKSTLLKLILGLIAPTSGQIFVQGHNVGAMNAQQRLSLGYLPENVSFYDNMTALELLQYFAKLKGIAPAKANILLAEFGLEAAKNQRLNTFSKGMRQRLGLAQAILANPKILLLDEPTVGLDPLASAFLYQKIAQLKAQGCAIIISTHELGLVQDQMERALILGQGRMLAGGSLASLRAATELPSQIFLHSLSQTQKQEVLSEPILSACVNTSSQQGLKLTIAPSQKAAVLHHLLQKMKLVDFSVEPPSLQDIFHHYMGSIMGSICDIPAPILSPTAFQAVSMTNDLKRESMT
ncbi:ABC transporter ATP-binding protein [Shewanella morhuae]|uniref:Lipopolysaccharide export system ATP-binding protein LptB n=1 Tax=Shewanella morhuae TaxID=365591 RepID=A0A380B3T5_9GAMM|nr:ABC transporter ATP-binding protein [Shewanella morhuae]SUI92590.1 Lipopolysaccharide export system ATP-binding protein LptB [Shewanella morhuae]